MAVALASVNVRNTQDAVANGDTRTLSFSHTHTDETATVTFKRDGRYDEEGLKQLNWLLRDWRRDEATKMDPRLFDIVWEVYRETRGSKPIRIVSGYRSPTTNAMLRSRGRGVAKFSQHMEGKAMDFYIPDVDLDDIRAAGLRLQRGGVGFYPTSGSPFVHLDTGTIRHWPRMNRDELARVFPDGRTVHLPADGRPLSGYDVAAREVESRGGVVRGRSQLAARSDADADEYEADNDGRTVYRAGGASTAGGGTGRRSLFAWLTGDADKPQPAEPPARAAAPDTEKTTVAQAAPQPARIPVPLPRPVAEPPMPAPRAIEAATVLPPSAPPGDGGLRGTRGSVPVPVAEAVESAPLAIADAHAAFTPAAASAPAAPALRQAASVPRPPADVGPAPARTQLAEAVPTAAPSGPAAPTLRWVAGPSGQPAPAAQTRPAPPAQADAGGGFALASFGSRPAPSPAADTTASVKRDLPPVITQGPDPKPALLAYAVPGDNALPRATPTTPPVAVPPAAARPPHAGPMAAHAAPAPTAAMRGEGGRDIVRMTPPRVDGPGLPRLITGLRFGQTAVDFRHPDQKAAGLLRAGRGVLDLGFSREVPEPRPDRFEGPAIRPLTLARFELAAR